MNYQQILASLILVLGTTAGTVASDALWADTAFCTIPDPKTGLTCQEIKNNAEEDVYYVVDQADFYNETLWINSQQDPETVRWNADQSKFILKYDAPAIPRSEVGGPNSLQGPMNHEEIMQELTKPEWLIDPDAPIVKGKSLKLFTTDDKFIIE